MHAMAVVESGKFHVVFLPYFTPSHMIPLVDAARLFAANGVKVTVIATPYNAILFQQSIDYNIRLGQDISILKLKFPAAECCLPEGIENFSAVTKMEDLSKVYRGVYLLQEPMEKLILEVSPDCIFSDMFFPWTADLAEKLKIPRILFYPNNFMSHSIPYNMEQYGPHLKVNSDNQSFLVPGLPNKIEMKRSQLEDGFKKPTFYTEIKKSIKKSELQSYCMVHNTVYELEAAYADYYRNLKGKKYYSIGPLFYFSNQEGAIANITSSDDFPDSYLNWLNCQNTAEVLFICFGSMAKFQNIQLRYIALALEASGQPFIWAISKNENDDQDDVSLLLDGLKQQKNGIIIRGWAPQLKILNHPAVGGFMTHCGWNSVMEAITAGVPMITWPLFAEHFYNEKLIEVMGFGVGVGADVWNPTPVIENLVEIQLIEKAIKRLMGDSEESRKIREKAKEGAAMVKAAVKECGSSFENLVDLIEDIKSLAFKKKD